MVETTYLHNLITCDLCKDSVHGHYLFMIGGKEMKVCNNCRQMITDKKDIMPRKKFRFTVDITVEAVTHTDAYNSVEKKLNRTGFDDFIVTETYQVGVNE
jgi:ribosome-binding protein aMBF1 (putative translation factor)